MSVNDLLNDDSFLPMLAVIFVVIIIISLPAGIALRKKTNKSIYGDDEYGTITEEKNAKVIARRNSPHPLNQAVMINMVVFELSNGNRLELAIKDSNTYGTMVEGDCGLLRYQGKRFISFERNT